MFEIHHDRGALIVTVNGSPNPALLAQILASLRTEPHTVVLDLSDVTLVDRSIWSPLNEALLAANRECRFRIVCTRLSTRRLLRRWGLPDHVPVLGTVEDAVPMPSLLEG